MLANAQIIALLATSDAARTRTFYLETLGLPLLFDDTFALVFDTNGVQLRIARVEKVVAAPYTALGWYVDDIAATVAGLAARGVTFERYDGMGRMTAASGPHPAVRPAWRGLRIRMASCCSSPRRRHRSSAELDDPRALQHRGVQR
ncbi:MAG TPA: VOC family protein [Dehalococcoidia bacterium]